MNRRSLTLVVALVPVVAFGVMMPLVPVPYVARGPGPTIDTLGEYEGKPVVAIEGTPVKNTTGQLNMTTVALRDGLTLGQALAFWASGTDEIVPRDLVYPPRTSRDDIEKSQHEDFQRSEDNAQYAALNFLKYPKSVTVEQVSDPGPSLGKLQRGDAIDAVNGVKVTTLDGFTELLKATKPDQKVVIDYRRKNGPPGSTEITLGRKEDRDRGFLGVGVRDAPWAPFVVDFNLANVGGPSAGLIFSLAVVDKLTTGDLSGSKFVAGTGTVDPDGVVGPIGGITHKMYAAQQAGASVFLVPVENCDEARTARDNTMRLIKSENLAQTVDALTALNSGGQPPGC